MVSNKTLPPDNHIAGQFALAFKDHSIIIIIIIKLLLVIFQVNRCHKTLYEYHILLK
jgi:hypothetical protein